MGKTITLDPKRSTVNAPDDRRLGHYHQQNDALFHVIKGGNPSGKRKRQLLSGMAESAITRKEEKEKVRNTDFIQEMIKKGETEMNYGERVKVLSIIVNNPELVENYVDGGIIELVLGKHVKNFYLKQKEINAKVEKDDNESRRENTSTEVGYLINTIMEGKDGNSNFYQLFGQVVDKDYNTGEEFLQAS